MITESALCVKIKCSIAMLVDASEKAEIRIYLLTLMQSIHSSYCCQIPRSLPPTVTQYRQSIKAGSSYTHSLIVR